MVNHKGVPGPRGKRWSTFVRRRVAFVLADETRRIQLVEAFMKLRVKTAEYDRNVYEGPILATWKALAINWRQLALVGVIAADLSNEFKGRIAWVVESEPGAEEPSLTNKEMADLVMSRP